MGKIREMYHTYFVLKSGKRFGMPLFLNYYGLPIGCCILFLFYFTSGITQPLANGIATILLLLVLAAVCLQMIAFSFQAGRLRCYPVGGVMLLHLSILFTTALFGIWSMVNPLIIVELFFQSMEEGGLLPRFFLALHPHLPLLYKGVDLCALAAFGCGLLLRRQEEAGGGIPLQEEEEPPRMDFYDFMDTLMPGFNTKGQSHTEPKETAEAQEEKPEEK